jgi:hypothetical protein
LFRILQDVVLRLDRAETELHTLKKAQSSKNKKEIAEYLNQLSPPAIPFREWTAKQTIEKHHLECVFENNLTDGIKMCIEEYMGEPASSLKSINIPICAFEQRPNIFYVYGVSDENGTDPNSWKRMDNAEFERWIASLSHKFLVSFTEWQNQNTIETEKVIENNMMYMRKIYGGHNRALEKERRIVELKKWLFSKIHISANSFVEIVI